MCGAVSHAVTEARQQGQVVTASRIATHRAAGVSHGEGWAVGGEGGRSFQSKAVRVEVGKITDPRILRDVDQIKRNPEKFRNPN